MTGSTTSGRHSTRTTTFRTPHRIHSRNHPTMSFSFSIGDIIPIQPRHQNLCNNQRHHRLRSRVPNTQANPHETRVLIHRAHKNRVQIAATASVLHDRWELLDFQAPLPSTCPSGQKYVSDTLSIPSALVDWTLPKGWCTPLSCCCPVPA